MKSLLILLLLLWCSMLTFNIIKTNDKHALHISENKVSLNSTTEEVEPIYVDRYRHPSLWYDHVEPIKQVGCSTPTNLYP